MTLSYDPVHNLVFTFSSEQLINIRITVNQAVKVIQCRTEMMFAVPINIKQSNSIEIENLSIGTPCNIEQVRLNYLDITPVMHEFTNTYEKSTYKKFGQFVKDIYSPDICVVAFDANMYQKIYSYFKNDTIKMVPPV